MSPHWVMEGIEFSSISYFIRMRRKNLTSMTVNDNDDHIGSTFFLDEMADTITFFYCKGESSLLFSGPTLRTLSAILHLSAHL
jgi:hypothetical protein